MLLTLFILYQVARCRPLQDVSRFNCVKELMDYLFTNFKKSIVIFLNLAYDVRPVRSELNVVEALEKCRQIFTQSFTSNDRVIKFIDSYAKIPYKLSLFPKIFDIGEIVKEIFPYNYYTSQRIFQNKSRANTWINISGGFRRKNVMDYFQKDNNSSII